MYISITAIPEGSFELRIFDDGHNENSDPIDTVCVLKKLSETECEVSMAKGHLYNQVNEEIGLIAYRMGYNVLKFKALRGVKVSRYAVEVSEDDSFTHYEVDLLAAASKLGVQRSTIVEDITS
jgi:hypothetical protein